ncbi:hypothetical protein [Ramlibacter tataouinensis]|uniref:hypothetical protein n=1 Tax=Ramlibacter tataouinensis TaxID=94132 RepID=UPI0002ED0766|nr:hypothetical protein [Ramlibacter tataouinensis]
MGAPAMAGAAFTITTTMNPSSSLTVGKYLVSPLTKPMANGWYACSVSIRSGSGRGTTDRVLRLTRLFLSPMAAAEYAVAEGLQWIRSAGRPLQAA